MFKCPDCKKWLVLSKTTVTKEYQGNSVQVVNVPAKECRNCGKLFVEDYVYKQIGDFLSFNAHEDILDYELFEGAEIAIITNMLWR